MQRILVILSLIGVACAYSLLEDLTTNCGLTANRYNLGFNRDNYRVKELSISSGSNNTVIVRKRFFPNKLQQESMSFTYSSSMLLEFIFVNETRICYRADIYSDYCQQYVREVVCQPLPTWKYSVWKSGCTAFDKEFRCMNINPASVPCRELSVINLFSTVVTKPARVITGFRVSDCDGAYFSYANDWLTVREGEVDLAPPETKQQLVTMNSTNFIQLMVSVCPRTAVAINDLISSLTTFVNSIDLSQAYIALTVFDGAPGYVDLLHFTNKPDLINSTIANLTNYVLRDDTCNIRQSVAEKFSEVSAHIYGQPWDTLNFVIYTATGDLVNYIPDDVVVVTPINRRSDISTFVIGQNLPSSQEALFRSLGVRGLFKTQDQTTTLQAFVKVADSIKISSAGFNLFGYCSASRIGQINAKIYVKYRPNNSNDGSYQIPGALIMELGYNASQFTPGCTAAHASDFCSPCTTVIDHRHIMCYECFNQSSVALSNQSDYAQVLLRTPASGRNFLYLPIPSGGAQFNVFVRFGGVSNPLLYDVKFLAVSQLTIELPEADTGALVGVYIDWNGYNYNPSLGVRIVPFQTPVAPPVTTPVTYQSPPVAAPVVEYPPIDIPVATPDPQSNTPVHPVQTPFNVPVAAPQYRAPVSSVPVNVPFAVPVSIPVAIPVDTPVAVPLIPPVNAPASVPFAVPVSIPVAVPLPTPVSVPVAIPVSIPFAVPVTQPQIPVAPPKYEVPVTDVPVNVPVSTGVIPNGPQAPTSTPVTSSAGPVAPPVVLSPVNSPMYSAGAAAGQNSSDDSVSSGVTLQSALILVFVSLIVVF